jgi:AAA family ATPase
VANEFGGYGQQMRDAVKLTLQGLALEPTISVRKDFMGAENCATFASSSDTMKETVQSILQKVSQPPKGLLIHGPPGTGKSKLMRAIVRALSQSCSSVELSLDILFKSETQSGDVERDLQKVFTQATESAPCCVLIDDMHLLCPSRGDSRGSSTASALQKRIVTSLLTLIDGVNSSNTRSVFIIATSAKPSGIDQAFRRPGRLDKEIELPVPSADERAEILRVLMVERGMAVHDSDSNMSSNGQKGSIPSETVRQIAKNAHGMVGSDLLLAIKEAHILACKDSQNGEGMGHLTSRMSALSVGDADGEGVSTKGLNESWGHGINLGLTVTLTESHLREAISKVNPSALREVVVEVPSVRWTDIGGMHEVKQSLKEVVEWPLEYPQLFASLNLSAPRGVLLYGPPGCSKTLMAKALATESSMNFLAVRGPELLSKWLGESEKAVQGLFRRARAAAPSIVFFDEIDALASKRGDTSAGVNDRVLSQLLAEIDGIQGLRRVVVIAATNRPDMLDSALMRPGRIDRKVYVPPPDKESREQILNLELRKMPLDSTVEGVISDVVDKSEGFSGAEVVAISQEAAMLAIDNGDTELSSDHLLTSVASITPQITPEMVRFYERLKASYK